MENKANNLHLGEAFSVGCGVDGKVLFVRITQAYKGLCSKR
jgi:hypothetical protein